MNFCQFWEKLKNLIIWVDYKRSLYFFVTILMLIIFLWNFPLRWVLLLGNVYRFGKGRRRYKKRMERNRKFAMAFVEYLISKFYH